MVPWIAWHEKYRLNNNLRPHQIHSGGSEVEQIGATVPTRTTVRCLTWLEHSFLERQH